MDFFNFCVNKPLCKFRGGVCVNKKLDKALLKIRGYAMRKLLLSTTALIAAGAISAANADVSISGDYTFSYQDYDTGLTVTDLSGDRFRNTGHINFGFSNKTDSGLEIGMKATLHFDGDQNADADQNIMDEHALYISGGFGKLQLGSDDGIGDQLTRSASDLIGKDALNSGETNSFHTGATANYAGNTGGNLLDDNADLPGIDMDDEANITYTLPTMGGLTAGVSFRDGGTGTDNNDDKTEFAGKYAMTAGNTNITLHYGVVNLDKSGTTTTVDQDASSMAIDISNGPLRAVYAHAQGDTTTANVETEIDDFGVQYKLNDALTLAAVQTEVSENTGGETLDVTSVSATYTIASGLTAYLTYHDYDYDNGDSAATDDDGAATMLSIKATF